eukprot:g2230.t1
MGDTNDSNENEQLFVYFDIGGTIFRILRGTIERYPGSLLGKLIEEFPNLGYESRPVFIDRSPKAFEWILEIYRNGHYDSCIPSISKEALVRELDFYQLPGMADLGLQGSGCLNHEIQEASKWCGKLLANELTRLDLWKSLPLYVCFYKIKEKDKRYGKEQIVMAHKNESTRLVGVPNNLYGEFKIVQPWPTHKASDPWIHVRGDCSSSYYFIRNASHDHQTFTLLKSSALAFGLHLNRPSDSHNSFPGAVLVSLATDET